MLNLTVLLTGICQGLNDLISRNCLIYLLPWFQLGNSSVQSWHLSNSHSYSLNNFMLSRVNKVHLSALDLVAFSLTTPLLYCLYRSSDVIVYCVTWNHICYNNTFSSLVDHCIHLSWCRGGHGQNHWRAILRVVQSKVTMLFSVRSAKISSSTFQIEHANRLQLGTGLRSTQESFCSLDTMLYSSFST